MNSCNLGLISRVQKKLPPSRGDVSHQFLYIRTLCQPQPGIPLNIKLAAMPTPIFSSRAAFPDLTASILELHRARDEQTIQYSKLCEQTVTTG